MCMHYVQYMGMMYIVESGECAQGTVSPVTSSDTSAYATVPWRGGCLVYMNYANWTHRETNDTFIMSYM
jgi:hypothetical protein